MTLEDRFNSFMCSYPGTESVDALLPAGSHPGKDRADYLVANRTVIMELKTLTTDCSAKIYDELSKHLDNINFPLIYGAVPLHKILQHLPDGDRINHRIHRNISRSVEDAVRNAKGQISDTGEIFNLQDTAGVLVLLNENIDVLGPDVVTRKVTELLTRKRTNGSMYTSIDFAWLLFESHITQLDDGLLAHPSILVTGPTAKKREWAIPIFDELQSAWARFNDIPLRHSTVEMLAERPFYPKRQKASPS